MGSIHVIGIGVTSLPPVHFEPELFRICSRATIWRSDRYIRSHGEVAGKQGFGCTGRGFGFWGRRGWKAAAVWWGRLIGVDLRVWYGVSWWCDAIAKGGREGGVKVAVGLSESVDRVEEREREREREWKWQVMRLRRLSSVILRIAWRCECWFDRRRLPRFRPVLSSIMVRCGACPLTLR